MVTGLQSRMQACYTEKFDCFNSQNRRKFELQYWFLFSHVDLVPIWWVGL